MKFVATKMNNDRPPVSQRIGFASSDALVNINVILVEKCGVLAIIVFNIKSSFTYRPSHCPAL